MQQTTVNDEMIEIDLFELMQVLLHQWWIILLSGIATGIIGFLICFVGMTPVYESTTSILIMSRQGGNNLSLSDTQLATQLTKDFEVLITSRTVLESVIEKCNLAGDYKLLKEKVSVSNTKDTRIINISVKHVIPGMAQQIADCIREVASKQIKEVTDVEAVNLVDKANLPTKPVGPSKRKWTMGGMFVGLFISALLIAIKYLLDDTIKTTEDVEKYLQMSTLALIPIMNAGNTKKGKTKSSPQSTKRETMTKRITEDIEKSHQVVPQAPASHGGDIENFDEEEK